MDWYCKENTDIDAGIQNKVIITLLFSLGAVVAVAQQSHIKKKMDRNKVDVNSQKGMPDRWETQCNHWRPLWTTLLE